MDLSRNLLDHPILVLLLSFVGCWASVRFGTFIREWRHSLTGDGDHQDFDLLLGSTLTLLGLIIGFTFSMALGRYDQRKNCEEGEANAIGTEYVRADLLPDADAARVHTLLVSYLRQRVGYYTSRDENQPRQMNDPTFLLQGEMWSALKGPAAAYPSPVTALVLSGMNDVLNSQGYTQAAWWNRIPGPAWTLLIAIALFCNFLFGYGARRSSPFRFLILPVALSICLCLIADIDSPRGGVIRVNPQNLESLLSSLRSE